MMEVIGCYGANNTLSFVSIDYYDEVRRDKKERREKVKNIRRLFCLFLWRMYVSVVCSVQCAVSSEQ